MGEWKEIYRERSTLGGIMQVGDLVKNIHTGEICIVTSRDPDVCDTGLGDGYVEVDSQWLVPEEHLEVVCE